MATFSKQYLSGSTTGKAIKVAATSTPGTTVHTAHATAMDEVWLWAYNSDTVSREVTVEFGSATAPDDNMKVSVPSKNGWYLLVDGQPLGNSLVVKAFAAAANVVTIRGYVNRIT